MSSKSKPDRLPFEPTSNRKKSTPSTDEQNKTAAADTPVASQKVEKSSEPVQASIPQAVSQRMARRMAIFSGLPTALGMSTFVVCYWIVSHGLLKLPNVVVVLVSMGFFGLGALGLSYGVLSASWDEEVPGSLWGWTEFTTNFGRMTAAWRSTRKKES